MSDWIVPSVSRRWTPCTCAVRATTQGFTLLCVAYSFVQMYPSMEPTAKAVLMEAKTIIVSVFRLEA